MFISFEACEQLMAKRQDGTDTSSAPSILIMNDSLNIAKHEIELSKEAISEKNRQIVQRQHEQKVVISKMRNEVDNVNNKIKKYCNAE
jgi:hypothetical protein